MATINLACSKGHDFEAWFRSLSDFEKQRGALLVACPWCGDHEIERRLSVPNVISTSRRKNSRTLAALEAMAKGELSGEARRELSGELSRDKDNATRDSAPRGNSDRGASSDFANGDSQSSDSSLAASPPMLAFAQKLRRMHAFVEQNCDDVGEKFAEEARRRHEEKLLAEVENRNSKGKGNRNIRGIRGKASIDEVRSLHEEGIEVTALPPLPGSYN